MKFLSFLSVIATATYCSAQAFYGLDFGINQNDCPNLDHYVNEFKHIQAYTNRVRSYTTGVCNEGALALEAANTVGMNIYLGMWVDRPETFDSEFAALKKMVTNGENFSNVDAIIVGSEVIYRKDATPDMLANYIRQVRELVNPLGIKVTTSEVFYDFSPPIVEAADFLMMNAFPYWEAVPIEDAASTLFQHYDSVVGLAQGKDVKIAETGWPSAGSNFGASVASPENQRTYVRQVLCEAHNRGVDVLYFSAKDESYKGGVEASFGIMDSNYKLKTPITMQDLNSPC
ncbi:glycoside hydrolase superfamily [Chlamydoabsidia padenii]|nr:glycoside hydrolase superfamily [Chlamydoabsidia padenii]